jgi:homoserine O-acetyltransferase/O-succinyltransferase
VRILGFLTAILAALALPASAQSPIQEADYVIKNYRFASGETLPEVRLHFRTMGQPRYDSQKRITNAVLMMHGSSGDASQVLAPSMIGPLTAAGGPLDAATHFLIFPDLLGAGKSTKPSDGLRAKFPRYGYGDMVDLEYRLITEHFRIRRLRLVMGISMGGMHTWMWGIRYPQMMDGLVAISSLPTKIDGRNLLWRRILSNAIRTDPEWKGGHYETQPRGFLNIMPMFDMLVQSPARLAERLTTYPGADAHVRDVIEETIEEDDANNILYRFEASFDYDPERDLEKITAPALAILFADDELNPVELGAHQRALAKVRNQQHVVLPAGAATEGHRTQVKSEVWAGLLADFIAKRLPRPAISR